MLYSFFLAIGIFLALNSRFSMNCMVLSTTGVYGAGLPMFSGRFSLMGRMFLWMVEGSGVLAVRLVRVVSRG